jgi:Uma2 family endonuclease
MGLIIREGIPMELNLDLDTGMSEDDFFEFCVKNPELFLERDKHGNIIIMAPVFIDSGNYESEANAELALWNRKTKAGMVFSSNAGFTLPNGAVRSPDASWISNERLAQLPAEERKKFAHICPDFVIEIRSDSDRLKSVGEKMEEYMENGAQLGFLIDPKGVQGFIYRPDGSVENLKGLDAVLSGEPLLPGFSLPLSLFQMD